MICRKRNFLGFEVDDHCEHSGFIEVENSHGEFEPNRQETKSVWGVTCCKCGRKRRATYYELPDA